MRSRATGARAWPPRPAVRFRDPAGGAWKAGEPRLQTMCEGGGMANVTIVERL
jgi:hypothetical protein